MQTPEIFIRDVGLEKNDRLKSMHTSGHRRSVWYKISRFTPSCEALGHLLKKKKKDDDEKLDLLYGWNDTNNATTRKNALIPTFFYSFSRVERRRYCIIVLTHALSYRAAEKSAREKITSTLSCEGLASETPVAPRTLLTHS